MPPEKNLPAGSAATLVLKLLAEADMYGYQMIETLARRSDHTFELKAGTLYPILHGLERDGHVESYEQKPGNERVRKYYRITSRGRRRLEEKQKEWTDYSNAMNKVLKGGAGYAFG